MHRLGFAFIAALFCAGCPENYPEPEPPPPIDPNVAIYLTTELEDAPAVRVQRLRGDIELKCDQLPLLSGHIAPADLDAALFDTGRIERLTKGARVALPRRPGAECDLVRFELPNGKVAL